MSRCGSTLHFTRPLVVVLIDLTPGRQVYEYRFFRVLRRFFILRVRLGLRGQRNNLRTLDDTVARE